MQDFCRFFLFFSSHISSSHLQQQLREWVGCHPQCVWNSLCFPAESVIHTQGETANKHSSVEALAFCFLLTQLPLPQSQPCYSFFYRVSLWPLFSLVFLMSTHWLSLWFDHYVLDRWMIYCLFPTQTSWYVLRILGKYPSSRTGFLTISCVFTERCHSLHLALTSLKFHPLFFSSFFLTFCFYFFLHGIHVNRFMQSN